MKYITIMLMLFFLFAAGLFAQDAGTTRAAEDLALKKVLVDSYVEGLHINRDSVAVKNGFHPDFVMHVYADGELIPVSLDMWLARLQLDGVKNTDRIEYTFGTIEMSGNSAVVRMEISENGRHIYTDFFGLYKFADGWKIVNKIFYAHE